ncbi:MAG TPA: lysophospholipid acyltransferase family protein [Xanthobacteraceae bacterium]|nr:lysophospholipid acyltransferase family protein [Xanthobacteraceae bacterium]
MWRTIRKSKLVRHALGRTMAGYLWSVHKTLRITIEPENIYEVAEPEMPVILTFWHGQHFLAPFIMKSHHRAKVLISRHADADVNAIAAEALGVQTIRGSGATNPKDFHRKNGVGAMREMIATLNEGINVALTADVPKISRVAGLGVVALARYSGRPIYPIAIATSRRIVAPSWDKASVDLPFGKAGAVAGEPIRVARDAGEAEMEAARKLVQERLNQVTARAETLAGVKSGGADG